MDPKLRLMAIYLSMKRQSIRVCKIYARILSLLDRQTVPDHSAMIEAIGCLAWERARLGQSMEAENLFARAKDLAAKHIVSAAARLGVLLQEVEFRMEIGLHEESRVLVEQLPIFALQAMREFKTKAHQTILSAVQFKSLRARCFYVSSLVLAQQGSMGQATSDARKALQLLRDCWATVDNAIHSASSPAGLNSADPERLLIGRMAQLSVTTGSKSDQAGFTEVSNLSAQNLSAQNLSAQNLYPLVTPLFECLLNYSNLCARQGSATEALYYAKQADRLSDKIKVECLQLECRTVMLEIHVWSQDVKTAIETLESISRLPAVDSSGLRNARYQCAIADLHLLQSHPERSRQALDQADHELLSALQTLINAVTKTDTKAETSPCPTQPLSQMSPNVRRAGLLSLSKSSDVRETDCRSTSEPDDHLLASSWNAHIKLAQRRAELIRRRRELELIGKHCSLDFIPQTTPFPSSPRESMRTAMANARKAASDLLRSISLDATYCAMADSVVAAFPLDKQAEPTQAMASVARATKTPARKTRARPKVTPETDPPANSPLPQILTPLHESRGIIREAIEQVKRTGTISDARLVSTLSAQTSLILAAIERRSSPARQIAPTLDDPGNIAINSEQCRVVIEGDMADWSSTTWPAQDKRFQDDLADVTQPQQLSSLLPASWSAVSIHLNENNSELTFCNYRHSQDPFILRIPLNRQSSGYDESETADEHLTFDKYKLEIGRIINLANASCHTTMGKEASRSIKAQWWEEREVLDARLEDLVTSMEVTWLGGFRGILSPNRYDSDALNGLRVALQHILDEYLPSRRRSGLSTRSRPSKFAQLGPRIVELFAALAERSENEGELDLSDELQDLLHFVVDALQFSGERNAYDEIDFDAMIIEAQDALSKYYDAQSQQDHPESPKEGHLVLILDRKLHDFPWESLPCLQRHSVSRLPSVSCLISRIRELRSLNQRWVLGPEARDYYPLQLSKLSYILNPSEDLTTTRDRLLPLLRHATDKENTVESDGCSSGSSGSEKQQGSQFPGIVDRPPTEDEFASMLRESDITLYFGHGSGAQYIRGRQIKKLLVDAGNRRKVTPDNSPTRSPSSSPCPSARRLLDSSGSSNHPIHHFRPTCAAALLLGCSSAQLTIPGIFEAHGPPLSYILAGSPAVVGCLWDVTDGDLDRFSEGLLGRWGVVESRSEELKQERERLQKRRKVRGLRKGRENTGEGDELQKVDLCEAVRRSRPDCYLRFLNGAAMVVYGVPCWVTD